MTDEMKAKRELLFSGSKNGYDRVSEAEKVKIRAQMVAEPGARW